MASKSSFLVGERGGRDGPKGIADARGHRDLQRCCSSLGVTQAVSASALQPARAAPRRRGQPVTGLSSTEAGRSWLCQCRVWVQASLQGGLRDVTFQHCFYGLVEQKIRYGHCL